MLPGYFLWRRAIQQDFPALWRILHNKGWEEVIPVVVQTVCSVAFYCQRCGKIHIHDIPYFIGSRKLSLRCSCRHEQAVLLRMDAQHIRLQIPCVVCNSLQEAAYSLKKLRRLPLEKIYCDKDHFELGYIGRRKKMEEILEFNRREFERLQKDGNSDSIEQQQIFLQALNRVHDIAASGGIACPCGSKEICADIQGSCIILECCRCGSYHVLQAATERDLHEINGLDCIDLLAGGRQWKKR